MLGIDFGYVRPDVRKEMFLQLNQTLASMPALHRLHFEAYTARTGTPLGMDDAGEESEDEEMPRPGPAPSPPGPKIVVTSSD